MAQYAAAIEGVDAGVGRLLDRLGAHRLREKTLVVFTSDHGFHFGHHGLVGKGNCTEPRNMYDWSIRVPLLASQPGTVPPGAASRAFVTFLDVLPTLLEHAGLPRPEVNLPGRSFRASMIGAKQGKPKTVYGEYGKTRMIRTPEWKYIHRYPDGLRELYDLRIDPGERANLAKDPAHAGRIRELRRRLEAWFAKYVIPGRDGTKLGP
jgi:arylsulfatase A-like enzyme